MAVRIQLKRDKTQNWYSVNPILLDGEMAIEQIDDNKVKIKVGDGNTKYIDLPYFADTISYLDIINKPFINDVEINGKLSLDDLGIQAKGEYVLSEELQNTITTFDEKLELKADKDNTYTKEEVDTFFNNLNNLPTFDDIESEYLKKADAETLYVPLTSESGTIYGVGFDGEQNNVKYTKYSNGSSIAFRDANGTFEVTVPQNDLEVANKQYVDEVNNTTKQYIDKQDTSLTTNLNNLDKKIDNEIKNIDTKLDNEIKNICISPNWANKVSISVETDYTVPDDGFIVFACSTWNRTPKLTINGIDIFSRGGNVIAGFFGSIPIAKNDVVKISGDNEANIYFIPYK